MSTALAPAWGPWPEHLPDEPGTSREPWPVLRSPCVPALHSAALGLHRAHLRAITECQGALRVHIGMSQELLSGWRDTATLVGQAVQQIQLEQILFDPFSFPLQDCSSNRPKLIILLQRPPSPFVLQLWVFTTTSAQQPRCPLPYRSICHPQRKASP